MADAGNTHEQDARLAVYGGVIHEDVMDKIWDISNIPLPFTQLIGRDTSGNHYKEFTTHELGAQDLTNAVADGADIDQNDSVLGTREGNWHQTSVKSVQISTRADAVRSIGRQATLSWQIAQAQKRLRRDVEGILLSNQASLAGNPETPTASLTAGLPAIIKTNVVGGMTAGGFDGAGIYDAATEGIAAALTETQLRDVIQMIYIEGGDPECVMMVPAVKRLLSEYLFTANARIALQYNPDQSTGGSTAYGTHEIFAADFAVVKLMDNRLQPNSGTADQSFAFVLDPSHLRVSYLRGYRVEPLAKTGLSEKRLMSVDYTLLCLNEKSQGIIGAIDNTAAVTFS